MWDQISPQPDKLDNYSTTAPYFHHISFYNKPTNIEYRTTTNCYRTIYRTTTTPTIYGPSWGSIHSHGVEMLIWIVKCRYNWYKTGATNGDILFTLAWTVTGIRYPINSRSKWWLLVLDLFLTCQGSLPKEYAFIHET
jgi:hypothetical protein